MADVGGGIETTKDLSGQQQLVLKKFVVVQWIMMDDKPSFDFRQGGQKTGVRQTGMSPSDFFWIFIARILSFVDKRIAGRDKLDKFNIRLNKLAVPIDSIQASETASCPWDCGGDDGVVGIGDFLAMLAQWGGPGDCDFDGGGVGINDFLALLANWGPCP